jgi:hypothetical protein
MSTKFEQLLDYLVNEEMDKANELFHEIVVEKSRSIYENLIAEEEAEEDVEEGADEDQEESVEEAEEDQEESVEESQDTEMDEGDEELEDSYKMETDDGFGGSEEDDATDALGMEIGAEHGDEEGGEATEDSAMLDIKNAIEELEAAFAELEQAQDGEHDSMDAEFGDEDGEEDGQDEMMGMPMEGRRITREYTEKVGNDWDKNSQKTQGQYLGAGTGDTEGAPVEGKSPIASGKNKPGPAGVNAKNLNQGATEGQKNTGERPNAPVKGITPTSGDKFAKGIHNVDGVKSGVKTLDKVAGGHGAEKKGSGPGPVGAGTGDKAGQTNIDPATKRQFLPSQG